MKGLVYKSPRLYTFLMRMKYASHDCERYRCAASYMHEYDTVLDLCAGPGLLKEYMPTDCTYTALDASNEMILHLKKRHIPTIQHDLHSGYPYLEKKYSVATMLLSLYQFRKTSINALLEAMQGEHDHVVIVEWVLQKKSFVSHAAEMMRNYLCDTNYSHPTELFLVSEFKELMHAHNFVCVEGPAGYMIAIGGRKTA